MASADDRSDTLDFLAGGGEMGARMRAHDWSTSPLGPPSSWPQSLRAVVGLMINSRYPMFVAWGPELAFLYNDGYAPIFGAKHPAALGLPFRKVWSEIWEDIRPLVDRALAGEPSYSENLHLVMERNGYPEDTWYSFSYSPVRDESGAVAGMFCACTETTRDVLAARREAAERERLARMFEQAPGFIAVLRGPDHVFEFANASHRRVFGDRSCVGRPAREALPELAAQGFVALLDRVYATGERFVARGVPLRLDPAPGEPEDERFLDFIYEPLLDESERVSGIFVEGFDVTDQHRAEAELRANARRLRFLDELGEATAPLTDAGAILAETTRLIGEHLNLTACAYADMDADGDGFTIRGGWGGPGVETTLGHHRLAEFGALAVERLSAGLPFVINDNRRELQPEAAETFQRLGVTATICMPLVKEGRLVALMAVHDAAPRVWTEAELGLVREVTQRSWADVERAAAAAELRASEARFRVMADAVPAIVWVADAEGRAEFFNRHWYDYTGASHDPTTALAVAGEHIHPDDAPDTLIAFRYAQRTGATFEAEHRIRSAWGDYRWFLVRGEPYLDPATGKVLKWYGASIDIDDRRSAEEMLVELNETLEQRIAAALAERRLLADLVENSDAFVQVADMDFRWLAINKASADEFERIYGVRPRIGESMLDCVAHLPEHQAEMRAIWSRALSGESFTVVAEFGDPDRDRRSYEMKFHVLRDADGEQIGAYQFVYDVTDRVREQEHWAAVEAARREADALYRAYFESSPEALFVIGVDGPDDFVVEQINPAHEVAIGISLEDARGRQIVDLLHPAVAERVVENYRHVLRTGATHQYREAFDLNGTVQYWDTSLVPVRDADGRIVRLIGSSRNMTRQVLAEEALRQSQKMEAMGQLTGGVAHDFNNLLTPIVGSLDMLQRKGLGGEREQRLIAGAAQSAERARTLVQRLLAFARRQPLQAVPVDLAKLVTGMGDLVASTTGPQIRVVVEAADDLPPALADPNQLEMALLNLAVNARDAMPDGGTLRISARAEQVSEAKGGLSPGRYLCLSVADTGTGMDEATMARAVEPFFSTKGVGKGTGLGLSMVHGLASQLGGALTISSSPGLGTNVELRLPESGTAAQPQAAPPEQAEESAHRGTVLLVDDEPLVRLSTADMLGDLGYRVVEASSAEEALAQLDSGEPFDLLVTDHLMPGMNGTELARAVRARWPSMHILLVSGYAEMDGIDADIHRLAKPFREEELIATLRQIGAGA